MRFLEDGREDDICAPETFHRAVEQRASGLGVEFKCEWLLFLDRFGLLFTDVCRCYLPFGYDIR